MTGFVFEFHLPYIALKSQKRSLENPHLYRYFGPFSKATNNSREVPYFHEAQISFLVYGPDEFFWTAYCFVDAYFQSAESTKEYMENGEYAPTRGLMPVTLPYWGPREYFLTVLSRRIQQITMEWKNIITELERELKVYASIVKPFSSQRFSKQAFNRNGAFSNQGR